MSATVAPDHEEAEMKANGRNFVGGYFVRAGSDYIEARNSNTAKLIRRVQTSRAAVANALGKVVCR